MAECHFMRHEKVCHFKTESLKTCCSRFVKSDLWIHWQESLRIMDDGWCCDSMNPFLAHDLGHAAFRPILKLSYSTRGRGKREGKLPVQGK